MEQTKSAAKAKLNSDIGIIEIEGTEDFVKNVLPDLIKHIKAHDTELPQSSINIKPVKEKTQKTKPSSKMTSLTPKLMSDLIPKDRINDFRTFFEEKSPSNHQESYTVIAYWMKYNLDVKDVSIDEVWTAHKILARRGPDNWLQVFRDVKSKKGYLDSVSSQEGRYYITPMGETLVEHDLPKKGGK
jgi:hypothetical protein